MRLLPLPAACLIAAAAASGPFPEDPGGFLEWPVYGPADPPLSATDASGDTDPWFPRSGPATREHADSVSRAAGTGTGIPAVDAWYGLAPVLPGRMAQGTELADWLVEPAAPANPVRPRVSRTGIPEVDAWYGLIPDPFKAAPKRVGTELSDWLGPAAAYASGRHPLSRAAPAAAPSVPAGHGRTVHAPSRPERGIEGHAGDRGTAHASEGPGEALASGAHGKALAAEGQDKSHDSEAHGEVRPGEGHASHHAAEVPTHRSAHGGREADAHGSDPPKAGHGDAHGKDSHGDAHGAAEQKPTLPPRPDSAFARAYDWEKGEAEILEYTVRRAEGDAVPGARGRLVTERLFLRRDGTVARRAGSKDDSDILQASLALAWEDDGQPYSVQTVSQLPRRGPFSLLRQEQARQGGPGTGHRSLDCRVAPPRLRISSSGGEAPVDTALPRWPIYTEEMLFTYLRALPLEPGYREEAWIQDWARDGRLEPKARYASITVRSRAPGVRDMDTWYLTVDRDDGRRSEYWISAAGLHPVVVARLADGSEWSLKGISRKPQRTW